jgi:hypothetical protein
MVDAAKAAVAETNATEPAAMQADSAVSASTNSASAEATAEKKSSLFSSTLGRFGRKPAKAKLTAEEQAEVIAKDNAPVVCGVSLDAPLGDNDGTVPDGPRYFTTKDRHGVFLPLSSHQVVIMETVKKVGNDCPRERLSSPVYAVHPHLSTIAQCFRFTASSATRRNASPRTGKVRATARRAHLDSPSLMPCNTCTLHPRR